MVSNDNQLFDHPLFYDEFTDCTAKSLYRFVEDILSFIEALKLLNSYSFIQIIWLLKKTKIFKKEKY